MNVESPEEDDKENSEPNFDLWNESSLGISQRYLSYRGLNFGLTVVMQLQSEGHP